MPQKGVKPKNFEEMQKLGWKKVRENPPRFWLGKKFSDEHRKKLSDAAKKRGNPPVFHGPHSEETKRIIGEHSVKIGAKPPVRFGSDNNMWRGGITKVSSYFKGKNRERRVLLLSSTGTHTELGWIGCKLMHANLCAGCGDIEPNIKLTEDHIVPLTKGGSDYIENIQPLCKPCNSKKYNKTNYVFA